MLLKLSEKRGTRYQNGGGIVYTEEGFARLVGVTMFRIIDRYQRDHRFGMVEVPIALIRQSLQRCVHVLSADRIRRLSSLHSMSL